MNITLVNSDLVNSIQSDRRAEAARQRLTRQLLHTEHESTPTFSARRGAASWLRWRTPIRLPLLSPSADPSAI